MKNRLARVCEVIKRELSALFLRDIDFGNLLVTISSVDITPDLKQAHVFISALGTKAEQRRVIELLEHNRVLMQSQMSKRVRIKHTPHLNFHIDEAMERGSRVLNVMNELGLMEIKPNADEEL
jgi:ribosome-binding factor A